MQMSKRKHDTVRKVSIQELSYILNTLLFTSSFIVHRHRSIPLFLTEKILLAKVLRGNYTFIQS